jgi:hypothetical protein
MSRRRRSTTSGGACRRRVGRTRRRCATAPRGPVREDPSARRVLGTGYDSRKFEARLNELREFITEIDGLDIQFAHLRSPHDDALPLLMTHGWPGSIIEFPEGHRAASSSRLR